MAGETKTRMMKLRRMRWILLVGALCAVQAQAQLTIGDNLKMNLSGSLGYGYSANFGDSSSGHGQNLVGNGTLTGSYYNPGFISFSARPYWDRNQNNGDTGAIAHDNGIDTSMTFFGGSSFPGAIGYSKGFSTAGEFGVPGIGGIQTNGTSQAFAVTWSELLPGLPPVWASFSDSNSSFSALGSQGTNDSSSKDFNLGTNYQLLGFNLNGNFSHGKSGYEFTDLLGLNSNGNSTSTTYSVGAQHSLPFRGGIGVSYGHSSYESKSSGGTSGSTNTLNANSSFMPWSRVSFSLQGQYTTNLLAAINQELAPGGTIVLSNVNNGSHALGLSSGIGFSIGHGWAANAHINRTSVSFEGVDNTTTQYGGMVSYHFSHKLLQMMHFSFGVLDLADKQGNSGAALVGDLGLDHRFGRWDTSADVSYSQDVQTLYGLGTTSNYQYGASERRKINQTTYWSGTFRGSHSGLTQAVGSSSGAQSGSSSLTWRRFNVAGSYSQSQGSSILSSTGVLVATTPGASLITNGILLFNGHSTSMSGSTRLLRRINVAGIYTTAHSELQSPTANTFAQSTAYNAHFDLKLRKMTLTGGFSRIQQDASALKTGPFVVNSFFLSLSRWFNVF